MYQVISYRYRNRKKLSPIGWVHLRVPWNKKVLGEFDELSEARQFMLDTDIKGRHLALICPDVQSIA